MSGNVSYRTQAETLMELEAHLNRVVYETEMTTRGFHAKVDELRSNGALPSEVYDKVMREFYMPFSNLSGQSRSIINDQAIPYIRQEIQRLT